MSFYAVAKGREVGIFRTWAECKSLTDGFKGAVFKKFDSKESAEAFISEKSTPVLLVEPPSAFVEGNCTPTTKNAFQLMKQSTTEFVPDYYVYTDGACSNNGKPGAKAGIGIYFGEEDSRNVSSCIEGKQSNNTAELSALLQLFTIIQEDLKNGKKIGIVSDSEYAIRCVTTYGSKCEKDGWVADIPNKVMVKQTYQVYKNNPNVTFIKCKAHTGAIDPHSIGNDGADRLANRAIGLEECPYSSCR
jgi:ribonuclease HI